MPRDLERKRAYDRAYRKANRDKDREVHAVWREVNRDRLKEVWSAWWDANADRRNAARRQWSRDNRARDRVTNNLSSMRKRMAHKRELIAQLEAQLKEPVDG